MDPLNKRPKKEKDYERALRAYMKERGWFTEKTHGNLFQQGFPDLYCMHPGPAPGCEHTGPVQRWVEVKRRGDGRLKPSQIHTFGIWAKHGVGVWILTGPEDYDKLWYPPNWWAWLDSALRS